MRLTRGSHRVPECVWRRSAADHRWTEPYTSRSSKCFDDNVRIERHRARIGVRGFQFRFGQCKRGLDFLNFVREVSENRIDVISLLERLESKPLLAQAECRRVVGPFNER